MGHLELQADTPWSCVEILLCTRQAQLDALVVLEQLLCSLDPMQLLYWTEVILALINIA